MMTRLASGFTLLLLLLTAGCGELPPSEANRFERERLEEEARQRQNLPSAVSNYRFSSTGSVDFEYVATFNKDSQVFTFQVTRRNGTNPNQAVLMVRADQPTLFDALASVFAGQTNLSGSETCTQNCDSTPVISLSRANGTTSQYRYPALYTAAGGSANNLITQLTTFILNRLQRP